MSKFILSDKSEKKFINPSKAMANADRKAVVLKGTSLLLFVAAVILSSFAAPPQAKGQEEKNTCLVPYEETIWYLLDNVYYKLYGKEYDPKDTSFYYNPYKIMVDTCTGLIWAKETFKMEFEHNIIPRKEIYEDNKLIYYTWEDILDKYKECKEGFKQLEAKFGKFKFVDRWTIAPDTSVYVGKEGTVEYKRQLHIIFDNYVCSATPYYAPDGPMAFIEKINLVQWPYFDWGLSGHYFNVGGITEAPQYDILDIYPNIIKNELTIELPANYTALPTAVDVYDTAGNTVKTVYTEFNTEQKINVSNLPDGHYIIKVGNSIGKFIIAR